MSIFVLATLFVTSKVVYVVRDFLSGTDVSN